jgi:hypothetical protein
MPRTMKLETARVAVGASLLALDGDPVGVDLIFEKRRDRTPMVSHLLDLIRLVGCDEGRERLEEIAAGLALLTSDKELERPAVVTRCASCGFEHVGHAAAGRLAFERHACAAAR